jgi:hypothetical protein
MRDGGVAEVALEIAPMEENSFSCHVHISNVPEKLPAGTERIPKLVRFR